MLIDECSYIKDAAKNICELFKNDIVINKLTNNDKHKILRLNTIMGKEIKYKNIDIYLYKEKINFYVDINSPDMSNVNFMKLIKLVNEHNSGIIRYNETLLRCEIQTRNVFYEDINFVLDLIRLTLSIF